MKSILVLALASLGLAPCGAADLLRRTGPAPAPASRLLATPRAHAVRPPLGASGDIQIYVDLNTAEEFSTAVAVVGDEIWVSPRGTKRVLRYSADSLRYLDQFTHSLDGEIAGMSVIHHGQYAGKMIALLADRREVEIMEKTIQGGQAGKSVAGPFAIGGSLSGEAKLVGIDANPVKEEYLVVDEGPDPDKPLGNAILWFLDSEFRAVRTIGLYLGIEQWLFKSACYFKRSSTVADLILPYGFSYHEGFVVLDAASGAYTGEAMVVKWPDGAQVEATFSGIAFDPALNNLIAIGRYTDRLYLLDGQMEVSPAPIALSAPEVVPPNRVLYTWANRDTYDAIDVYENFQLLATLPGTATEYELVGAVGDEIVEIVARAGTQPTLFTQIWTTSVTAGYVNDDWHFVAEQSPGGLAWDPVQQFLLFAFEDGFVMPVRVTMDPVSGMTGIEGFDGFPTGLSSTTGVAVTPEGQVIVIDGQTWEYVRIEYLVDPAASPTTTFNILEGPLTIANGRVGDVFRDFDGLPDGTFLGVNTGKGEVVHFGQDMAILERVRRPEFVLGGYRQSPAPTGSALAVENGVLRLPGSPWWLNGLTTEIYWAGGFEEDNPDRSALPFGPGQGLAGAAYPLFTGIDVIPELDRTVLLADLDGPLYCWINTQGQQECAYDPIVFVGGAETDRSFDIVHYDRQTVAAHSRIEVGPILPTREEPFFYVTVVNRSTRGPVPTRIVVTIGDEEVGRDLPAIQRQSVIRRGYPGNGCNALRVSVDNDYDTSIEFEVIVSVKGGESLPPDACSGGGVSFIRGDVDSDGIYTIGDAILLLNYLFSSGTAPSCPDTGDFDDSGQFEIGDAVGLLNFQFANGADPAPPGRTCGPDPTGDLLPACSYPNCP
ncbi:MAG: hypothetical protein JXP34_12085 [Planctomycetes bacterium]|nr:hypothetical protein [Planctomycetota bacterium]